jgi:hypothetical protein
MRGGALQETGGYPTSGALRSAWILRYERTGCALMVNPMATGLSP